MIFCNEIITAYMIIINTEAVIVKKMLTEQHLRSILQINTLIVKIIRWEMDWKCKRSTLTTIAKGK